MESLELISFYILDRARKTVMENYSVTVHVRA